MSLNIELFYNVGMETTEISLLLNLKRAMI